MHHPLRLLLLALGLSACDAPVSDREHDMRATLGPVEEGRDHCLEISAPAWRDECMVWQALRAADEGFSDMAELSCDATRTPGWSERCWDEVARRSEPERGLELCRRAGEDAEACRTHTLERAVLDLPDVPGQELALRVSIATRVATWGPTEEAEVDRLWALHLSRREDGSCGEAPQAVCDAADGLRRLEAAVAEVESGEVRPLERLRLGVCDVMDVAQVRSPSDLALGHPHLDEAVELGFTLVRPHRARGHVFARNAITPADGKGLDFTLPDAVVAAAQARELDLLVTLEPQAELAQSQGALIHPVAHDDAWAPYITAVVERYDGDGFLDMPSLVRPVKYWEIGNEPSCPLDDTDCLDRLTLLATRGMEAARAADPEATVVLGGAAPVLMEDGTVNARVDATWRHLAALGVLEASDAVSFHYRVGSRTPPLGAYLAHWRALVGEDTPLWLTETGPVSWHEAKGVDSDSARVAGWTALHLRTAEEGGVELALVCRAGRELAWEPVLASTLKQLGSR